MSQISTEQNFSRNANSLPYLLERITKNGNQTQKIRRTDTCIKDVFCSYHKNSRSKIAKNIASPDKNKTPLLL